MRSINRDNPPCERNTKSRNISQSSFEKKKVGENLFGKLERIDDDNLNYNFLKPFPYLVIVYLI